MKSKKKSPKAKKKSSCLKKTQDDLHLYSKSKEEILKLKEAYKNGTLKFNAKDIAEAILEDTYKGMTE